MKLFLLFLSFVLLFPFSSVIGQEVETPCRAISDAYEEVLPPLEEGERETAEEETEAR